LHLLKADESDIDFPFAFSELVNTLRAMGRLDDIPEYIDRFYMAENLPLERLEWVLDCLSAVDTGIAYERLCLNARDRFSTNEEYCAWLTEICYMLHTPKTAISILDNEYADSEDPYLFEHLGYFYALLYLADGVPLQALHHLQNALVIYEDGITEDFLDIDTDKLYEQYPDIYYLVSPYLDRISDVRNN
jgi:hypothetical protein